MQIHTRGHPCTLLSTHFARFAGSQNPVPERWHDANVQDHMGQDGGNRRPGLPLPAHALTRAASARETSASHSPRHSGSLRSRSKDCNYMTAMSQHKGISTVRFDATLDTIDEWTILRLPKKAS